MTYLRQTITEASPAAASTTAIGATALDIGVEDYDEVKLLMTVQGGTGGTLDIVIQGFDGTNWFDVASLPQLADGAAQLTQSLSLSRAETSPATSASVQVGLDLVPQIAADVVVPGEFGRRLRMIFTTGVGNSAGANQTMVVTGKPRRH